MPRPDLFIFDLLWTTLHFESFSETSPDGSSCWKSQLQFANNVSMFIMFSKFLPICRGVIHDLDWWPNEEGQGSCWYLAWSARRTCRITDLRNGYNCWTSCYNALFSQHHHLDFYEDFTKRSTYFTSSRHQGTVTPPAPSFVLYLTATIWCHLACHSTFFHAFHRAESFIPW